MSDGTPPNEVRHPSAATPPPHGPEDAPAPPSAPPYAASAPAPPYAAPYPAPPYTSGPGAHASTPRQEFPGAPPTWGPGPAPAKPAPGGGSAVLAILALIAAILGVLASFTPFIGPLIAWVLIPTAIVLAVIALVSRAPGTGMAIAALIVAVVGTVLSIGWTIVFVVFGGIVSSVHDSVADPIPDDEYSYPSLSAPQLDDDEATLYDPLAPGTTVTIHDDTADDDVWQLTVGSFEDVTAAAAAAAETPPLNGAYTVVPIDLTNLTDDPIDLTEAYEYVPYSWLATGDGDEAESTFFSEMSDYPDMWDIPIIEAGETVTYYEVFDVDADTTTTGTFIMQLDSGQALHWRPALL